MTAQREQGLGTLEGGCRLDREGCFRRLKQQAGLDWETRYLAESGTLSFVRIY
ncbi:MAG: hypothetical protein H0U76_25455 [Ktedonobacteraceae bacterium]|nr:hypothetical protein [Ktedonobacteraceae bacterium]